MADAAMIGLRNGQEYEIKDDIAVLDFFFSHKDDDAAAYVKAIASNIDFWGEDLTAIDGFCETVTRYVKAIEEKGTYEVMKKLLA